MAEQRYSPVNDARYNALRHLCQSYPKAFEIRWSRCELCGSRYLVSFIEAPGQRRKCYCTRCGAHVGHNPAA
jgi:hypothetical protein